MALHRLTPPWLLALGSAPPPARIEQAGASYTLERVFKHDFWAFTALYRSVDPASREPWLVLKIARRTRLFGLPLGWIGRLLARHECLVYERLAGSEVLPRFTGRHGSHGVTHAYVPGRLLRRAHPAPDGFFACLSAGLEGVHRRGVACLDLSKFDNVLIGEDGRPYLFDLQIAWYWPAKWGGDLAPMTWIRRLLQRSDRYHLAKLWRRTRPDQIPPEELAVSWRPPWSIRLHKALTSPLQWVRRGLLQRIDPVPRPSEHGRGHVSPDEL